MLHDSINKMVVVSALLATTTLIAFAINNIITLIQLKPIICFWRLKNFQQLCQNQLIIRNNHNPNNVPAYFEAEALAYLRMALDMWARGKIGKSQKLFQHAISLFPHHPDILNEYGRFTEVQNKDLLAADYLYGRALALKPDHPAAKSNKDRLGPVVDTVDRETLRRIDEKRAAFQRIPDTDAALRRAKLIQYYAQIYHTNAVEGNTLDLPQTRYILETKMVVGSGSGKTLREHNEVLGLDLALRFVNQTLVARSEPLTALDILAIHRRILAHVEPFTAGTIRTEKVYVGGWTPPAPELVLGELEELAHWLARNDPRVSSSHQHEATNVASLHPVEYAALAHYHLVAIHPFADGNGRTARLLMNALLMRLGYPPAIVRLEDRQAYYDTLKSANAGDLRPFIRFITFCAEHSLDVLLAQSGDGDSNNGGEKGSLVLPPVLPESSDLGIENCGAENPETVVLPRTTEIAASMPRELKINSYPDWMLDCPAIYTFPVLIDTDSHHPQENVRQTISA